MIRSLQRNLLAIGLFFSVMVMGWGVVIEAVLANKTPELLMFDSASGEVNMVSVYATTAETQADTIKTFFKTSKSFYKKIPGFHSFSMLASQDGARIIELTQWQDQASYDAFKASLTSDASQAEDYTKYYEKYKKAKDKGQSETKATAVEPFLTASFVIDQVVSPPGLLAAIAGGASLVQFSGFTTDTVEHQDDLLAMAQTSLAAVPAMYPAPRTTVLLKGVESPYVALLANWGNTTEFSDLDQIPRITLTTESVEQDSVKPESAEPEKEPVLMTTDDNLYQVVKVISSKPETYDKD